MAETGLRFDGRCRAGGNRPKRALEWPALQMAQAQDEFRGGGPSKRVSWPEPGATGCPQPVLRPRLMAHGLRTTRGTREGISATTPESILSHGSDTESCPPWCGHRTTTGAGRRPDRRLVQSFLTRYQKPAPPERPGTRQDDDSTMTASHAIERAGVDSKSSVPDEPSGLARTHSFEKHRREREAGEASSTRR
jgi:hypothetical protein